MERARRSPLARIVPAGDAALLVRFGSRPGPGATRRVLSLVAALDTVAHPAVLDVIPAYASVLVRYNPLAVDAASMEVMLRAAVHQPDSGRRPRGRLVRIPVRYGGRDGPDLEDVAQQLGMSVAEVIARHTAASYRVSFLGFLAGFPYLSGLPRALAMPRLDTPRTHVPGGSVAIAERQAGIYPVASPGGWRILGRTTTPLFDADREPPSLLHPGDRVRFHADETQDDTRTATVTRTSARRSPTESAGVPWLRVRAPGLLTTVQDAGRFGYARYGVTTAGAADPDALEVGSAMLGNEANAAALEVTGGDASFQMLAPCVVAITGAIGSVRVNDRPVDASETLALAAGDVLEIGPLLWGMRVYLSVAGGIEVPPVMGSRATDTRASLGGMEGRPLRMDDMLRRGEAAHQVPGRTLPGALRRPGLKHGAWTVRILPGVHVAMDPAATIALCQARFAVDARSDRVGVRLRRLDGPCLEGGQVLSEGIPRGAVQLPPDGEPVLLLADAQATGGYRVPAVVVSADLWKIGQLRPGDTVRFQRVAPVEAIHALRRRAQELAQVRHQPFPGALLGGFTEWSDECDG